MQWCAEVGTRFGRSSKVWELVDQALDSTVLEVCQDLRHLAVRIEGVGVFFVFCAVTIGVGVLGVGARVELLLVGPAVAIGIIGRIIDGDVQLMQLFPTVVQPIGIEVVIVVKISTGTTIDDPGANGDPDGEQSP